MSGGTQASAPAPAPRWAPTPQSSLPYPPAHLHHVPEDVAESVGAGIPSGLADHQVVAEQEDVAVMALPGHPRARGPLPYDEVALQEPNISPQPTQPAQNPPPSSAWSLCIQPRDNPPQSAQYMPPQPARSPRPRPLLAALPKPSPAPPHPACRISASQTWRMGSPSASRVPG